MHCQQLRSQFEKNALHSTQFSWLSAQLAYGVSAKTPLLKVSPSTSEFCNEMFSFETPSVRYSQCVSGRTTHQARLRRASAASMTGSGVRRWRRRRRGRWWFATAAKTDRVTGAGAARCSACLLVRLIMPRPGGRGGSGSDVQRVTGACPRVAAQFRASVHNLGPPRSGGRG